MDVPHRFGSQTFRLFLIEVMYRYLEQGNTEAAIQYLDDLRTPVREIAQTVWTGDEAIDYLINSKMTFAEQQNRVLVYPDNRIEIAYKIKDIFD